MLTKKEKSELGHILTMQRLNIIARHEVVRLQVLLDKKSIKRQPRGDSAPFTMGDNYMPYN